MSAKKKDVDYSLTCRTCLQSNVELLFLSALIHDNLKEESSKISYLDCLKMCIQFDESANDELPQKICLECASALQVSYWFIKNATQADNILRLKLADIKRKNELNEVETSPDVKKSKRYRCKICNVKLETKRSLKDHIKLHLDIIVYNCQFCSFESHERNDLSDHYIQIHAIEATREQLKPKTKLSSPSCPKFCSNNDRIDGAFNSDHFHILPEENSKISDQNVSMNTMCDVESLQASTLLSQNSNYSTISEPFNIIGEDIKSDFNIANEFMVMADGSLEKVLNKGVVIEFIDAQNNNDNLTLDNGLALNNMLHVQNINDSLILEQENALEQMDVDDLIIVDPGEIIEENHENIIQPLKEEIIPATIIEQPKKIMCKICTKDFLTQEKLKNHMLTHNEIPHFFCDQCKFYTFFKIDLHQHYKSKHNMQPTNKQLQPKNQQKAINEYYTCNLCFYEAETKFEMKRHYKVKHNIEANETHLKPTKVERIKTICSSLTAKAKAAAIVSKPTTTKTKCFEEIRYNEDSTTPDYPNGLNCRKCKKVFYFRKQLYEHYKMHSAEEAALKQAKQITKVQNKSITSNLSPKKSKSVKTHYAQIANNSMTQLNTTNTSTYSSLDTLSLNVGSLHSVAPPHTTHSTSSTYTLPSDAIPQIVETDLTIDNNIDFDFNCDDDVLFEDFDDDVDVENNSNDNDLEFRNVLLTSDDDLEDMVQHKNSADDVVSGSLCAHCQKSFLSQYQFENHMFLHRGLAPYRCEMCTNLYNRKRCLIRHYNAVHQNVPTRDMIQAKGDKVFNDKISIEHLNIEPTICFLCGMCPYESSDFNSIKYHLKSSHNITDETFIIKKLPFECPRCIRSFANKILLLRHLERNHSLTPFNQPHNLIDSENSTIAITTDALVTSESTTINNHVNMMKKETIETNASCGKINKVNTSASSTTKFLTNNPIQRQI